jgi:putative PIN family toxin of toxin-antitoxin system
MRVVLDVNVLVSARITLGGEADKLLIQAEAQYDLLLSDFMLWKLDRVLHYDRIQAVFLHLTEDVISAYVDTLREMGNMVTEQTVIAPSPETSNDPEDLRILAAAVDGKADYLVTYNDKHFPGIYGNISILIPKNFGRMLSS